MEPRGIVPLDPVTVAWIAGAVWLAIVGALALRGRRQRRREEEERRDAIRQAEMAEAPPFIHPARIRIEAAKRGHEAGDAVVAHYLDSRGEDGQAPIGRAS